MAKESELKVSKHGNFKLSKTRIEGMKELKRLKAVGEGLVKQQAKLKAKLNIPGQAEQAMDQLRRVNHLAATFNAWIQMYAETKLADPAWDAANQGK